MILYCNTYLQYLCDQMIVIYGSNQAVYGFKININNNNYYTKMNYSKTNLTET